MIELVNQMETALVFIEDANNSPDRLKSLEKTTAALLKEIGECCVFVRKYIHKQGSFFGNEYKSWIVFASILTVNLPGRVEQSSSKSMKDIEDFRMKFEQLHVRLNTATSLQVSYSSELTFQHDIKFSNLI